jgi:hypothetical protein
MTWALRSFCILALFSAVAFICTGEAWSHPVHGARQDPATANALWLACKDVTHWTTCDSNAAEIFLMDTAMPSWMPMQASGEAVVSAACGASHSVLLMGSGVVYTAGANSEGQCGQDLSLQHVRDLQETRHQ